MSKPMTQPIATHLLRLTGSPALLVGGPAVGPRRTWDDQSALFGADSRHDVRLVEGRPADVSTDLFGAGRVVRFENSTNPSDIRVTTRGIPV